MSSEEVRLYDLRERKYPHQRGDVFRSLQVFECWVCGALSNKVVMGGWPGYGVRCICPSAAECWHHELEDKIKALDEFLNRTARDSRIPFLKEIKNDDVFEENAAEARLCKDGAIRTKIPYRCKACGALTNKVVVKEKRGKEVVAPLCPQADRAWHRRMVKKFKRLAGKTDKTVGDMRKLHREKIKNDLAGNPDLNFKESMTNIHARKQGQICSHYI